MKDKYIADLVMAVIYKNHDKIGGKPNFIIKDNIDYISCDEDAYLISLSELRETLEDIFGESKEVK